MLAAATILAVCTQATTPEFPEQLEHAAETHQVDEKLLLALVAEESRCNHEAINSRSNAIGYGQIIPRWWEEKAVELDYDLTDPGENLLMSAYILRRLTRSYTDREALRRYLGYRIDRQGSWEAADAYASRVLGRKSRARKLEKEHERSVSAEGTAELR